MCYWRLPETLKISVWTIWRGRSAAILMFSDLSIAPGPAGTNASASSDFQIPQARPSRQVVRRLDVGCEADRLKRLDEPPAEINLSGK